MDELEIIINLIDDVTGESEQFELGELLKALLLANKAVVESIEALEEELPTKLADANRQIFDLETKVSELTSRIEALEAK